MKFDNKVVVITGAARGLGQEYARQFARRGAHVVVSDLRGCEDTLAAIENEGADGLAVKADVTDAGSTARMAEAAVSIKVELKKMTVASASGRLFSEVKNASGAKKPKQPRSI